MKRNSLVEEIENFCADYGVNFPKDAIKSIIAQGLKKAELIEIIYNKIFIEAKRSQGVDIERVKELLNELHKIRLDLEFRDYPHKEKTIKPKNKIKK